MNLTPQGLNAVPERVRETMRMLAVKDTFYLATVVLGYTQLTADVHGPLCVFLDTCECSRRLIQMPRSHFKTTIVTITHRIREQLNHDWHRILIVGDASGNASAHLRKIKNHYESNAILRWLFPEKIWEDPARQAAEWSQQKLFLPTKAMHGEPTFSCIGARGAVVSQHFDTINADDLIAEDEAYSETEMSRTIEWFTGLESLFVPPIDRGQLDIPSTFWRMDDVYAFAEKFFGGNAPAVETGPFSYQRGGIAVFRRGARNEDGTPIFPQAVTTEFLDRLQEINPERYAAQYANNPMASGVAYFPAQLSFFEWADLDHYLLKVRADSESEWKVIRVEDLYLVSFCDPHAGGGKSGRFRGSRAAVHTTGVDVRGGRIFVLDSWVKKAGTGEIIDEIFRQNERWLPQAFSIEANGLQRMLRYWIDERVERDHRLPLPYVPYIPQGDKDGEGRIKGLQPLIRAGQLLFHKSQTALVEEIHAYPRGFKDALDALAQGLKHWNVGFDAVEQEALEDYEREIARQRSVVTGY